MHGARPPAWAALLLLAVAASLCIAPGACLRAPGGDPSAHLLVSGGVRNVLSNRSTVETRVDLGLGEHWRHQQQRQRRWPWTWWRPAGGPSPSPGPSSADSRLADPATHTVFAANSAFARLSSAAAQRRRPADGAAGFDPARAAQLAQLQSIAYCADLDAVAAWTCSRCGAVPDFQPAVVHFDEAWDLLGYAGYWPSLGAKVLVFRGTDSNSWYNWAENMRAWRTDATYPVPGAPRALRIHSGFLVLYNSSSMASTFSAAFDALNRRHPSGPTFVLGHSMGGALAQLAALDLRIKYGLPDVRVYTFGAPRVGNVVFAQFLEEQVAQSWRFTHGRDIVPSVPPLLMGFHHASREVWLVDVEAPAAGGGGADERVVVCDESGEDPSCHNAACRLGLCTSVADHLVYLDAHMYRGGEC